MRGQECEQAQAVLAERLERQREKQIAHLEQIAAARMGKASLARAWQTWLDLHLEQRWQERMLRATAGRLLKPAVAAALALWRASWRAEEVAALAESQRALRGEREALSAEGAALRAELEAAREVHEQDKRKQETGHEEVMLVLGKDALSPFSQPSFCHTSCRC